MRNLKAVLLLSMLSLASTVQAALPASAATAFTDMEADFETVFGYGFAVLVTIAVAMIGWKYVRKLGNRI